MNLIDLLKKMEDDGVVIALSSNGISCTLPDSEYVLSEEICESIRHMKDQIIDHLQPKSGSEEALVEESDVDCADLEYDDVEVRRFSRPPLQASNSSYEMEFPLSCQQESLWFIGQMESDQESAYNEMVTLSIIGEIDLKKIRASIDSVIQCQDILRTSFYQTADGPRQKIRNGFSVDDYFFKEKKSIEEVLDRESRHRFMLDDGPLIRFFLVEKNSLEYTLFINAHHIIFDGWSVRELIRQLSAYYSNAIAEGMPSEGNVSEGTIQYHDYAIWQKNWLCSNDAERQRNFWCEYLRNAPENLRLPGTFSREKGFGQRGKRKIIPISPKRKKIIDVISRQLGVTPFVIYFSVLNTVLSAYSGQREVVVGTSVANRHFPELEGLIGYFVNSLAIRTVISDTGNFKNLVEDIKGNIVKAIEHQDFPFEKVVESINPKRNISSSQIFQVLFVMQNIDFGGLALGDAEITVHPDTVEAGKSKFDLLFEVVENKGQPVVRCQYNMDLYDEKFVDSFIESYLLFIEALPSSIHHPLLTEIEKISRRKTNFSLSRHHVGIACDDVENTSKWLRQIFCTVDLKEGGKNRECLEISGLDHKCFKREELSPYINVEEGLAYVCYSTTNMANTLQALSKKGYDVISAPDSTISYEGETIVFANTPLGVIGLIENKSKVLPNKNIQDKDIRFGGVGIRENIEKVDQLILDCHGVLSFKDDRHNLDIVCQRQDISLQKSTNDCDLYIIDQAQKNDASVGSSYAFSQYYVDDLSAVLPRFLESGCKVKKAPRTSNKLKRVWLEMETPIGSVLLIEKDERPNEGRGVEILGRELAASSPLNVIVGGTFTTEPIIEYLLFWAREIDFDINVDSAPYDQVFQELVNPSSLMRQNSGYNILLIRWDDWLTDQSFDHQRFDEFVEILLQVSAHNNGTYIVVSTENQHLPIDTTTKLDATLSGAVDAMGNVSFISSAEVLALNSVDSIHDDIADTVGHIPYSLEYYCALSATCLRKIHAFSRKPYKVLVLDCDNTLWQGVSGEVGALNVGISEPYQFLQNLAINCQRRGMLLALCSRNQPDDVWKVFDEHDGMLLNREHIVTERINWNRKSENIRSIAKELNLGLDSFIFVDDDPLQCEEVRTYLPDVTTILLPDDPENIPTFLNNVWAFDTSSENSEISSSRTEMYRREKNRNNQRSNSRSLADFVDSLRLDIRISDIDESIFGRASELLLRTNQFNFSGIRMSVAQISEWLKKSENQIYMIKVTDRFGDYGVVGLAVMVIKDSDVELRNMVLSCRSLGRGVEHYMLNFLVDRARAMGKKQLLMNVKKTEKNQPALDFLCEVIGGDVKNEAQRGGEISLFIDVDSYVDICVSDHEKEQVESRSENNGEIQYHFNAYFNSSLYQDIADNFHEFSKVVSLVGSEKRTLSRSIHTSYQPPVGEVEKKLASVWSSLLNLPEGSIGRQDGFFNLGGHSLLATQLISRIYTVFDIEITLHQIFEDDCLQEISKYIDTYLLLKEQGKWVKNVGEDIQPNDSSGDELAPGDSFEEVII